MEKASGSEARASRPRAVAPAPVARLQAEAGRLVRFGVVGVAATGCHYLVALGLALGLGAPAQLAHVAGFATALPVSFFGHYHWSFKSAVAYGPAALRFVAVAVAAFAVSAVALEALGRLGDWDVAARLFVCVLLVPAASYALNRVFVF